MITTGIKRGMVDEETTQKAISIMSGLNRAPAEEMQNFDVHACTDVTGFGLLGHLKEVTLGSKVDAIIYASKVPVLKQARELALAGIAPGGTLANVDYVKPFVQWNEGISEIDKLLLCDAQTSGGLIIVIPKNKKEELLNRLHERGIKEISCIGEITGVGEGIITVKP